jgi:hypothetical protein
MGAEIVLHASRVARWKKMITFSLQGKRINSRCCGGVVGGYIHLDETQGIMVRKKVKR